MITAYIGIGSNLGDKELYVKKALEMLDSSSGVTLIRTASLYRTAPVGYLHQDWFLNTVAEIETGLGPCELLNRLQSIENELGRVRNQRWGPRTIDLDLLIYGSEIIDVPGLAVPHPRMGDRAFVMVPLSELAPDLIIPGVGKAGELAEKLVSQQPIKKYLWPHGSVTS